MTYLHFDITGDCSSAIAALENTEQAADHLAGRNFEFGMVASGADDAIREVGRVTDAVAAAGGLVSVGADTSGLNDAHGAVSSLRGNVQGLAQDLGSLSGVGVDLGGGGALRDFAGDMSGLSAALGSVSSGMSDFNDVGAGFGRTSSDVSRASSQMRQEIEGIAGATDGLTASTRELVSVQSDGAQVMNAVGSSGGTPGGSFGGGGSAFGGSGGAGGSGGSGGGPPGGGGRPFGAGGVGGDDGGEGFGALGQPMMMGTMIGGAESLVAGAAGFLAVNEAIKENPALAAAETAAMGRLTAGIQETSRSAIGQGIPALQQLGNTLHGFGAEVGAMGAEHMATALSGANDMAATATQTLRSLDPAVESSMKGLTGLADSVMNGIGNPATVQAIKTTSDALQDPNTQSGVTSLVSAISTVAGSAATVAADGAGVLGGVLGGGRDAEGPMLGAGLGGYIASKMGLGRGGMMGGAAIGGIAAMDSQNGVDPTSGIVGGAAGLGAARLMGLGGGAGLVMGGIGELLAHDPAVQANLAGTGAQSQPDSWMNSSLTGQALGGIGGVLGDAWGTAKDLMDHGDTHDTPKAVGGFGDGKQVFRKPQEDPFMAALLASGGYGSLGGGGGMAMVGADGGGSWTSSVPGGQWGGGGGGISVPIVGTPASSPPPAAAAGIGAGAAGSTGSAGGGPASSIPKGIGESGSRMTASDLAGLGIGPPPGSGTGAAGGGLPGGLAGGAGGAMATPSGVPGSGVGVTGFGMSENMQTFTNPLGVEVNPGNFFAQGPAAGFVDGRPMTDAELGAAPPALAPVDAGAAPRSVGDLSFGGPTITSQGLPPGWGQGPYVPPGASQVGGAGGRAGVGTPGAARSDQGARGPSNLGADLFRGGITGSGPGSSVGATSELSKLNEMMGQTQARSAQLNQSNSQLGQSLSQVGQHSESAAQGLGQDQHQAQSLQSGMQGLSSGAGSATSSMGELAKSAEGATSSASGLGAAVGGAVGDSGLGALVGQVGTGISAAASISGQAAAQSMAQGITSGSGSVSSAASEMGQGAVSAGAAALKSKSPSQEFVALGESTGQGGEIGVNNSMPAMAGAVTGGLNNVLDAARGVANDNGLMVGYTFVESMTTGAQQAVKASDFMQLDSADIKSPLAKAALGAAGLLGPAGSGAQSYQLSAQEVSFAAANASAAVQPQQTIVLQPQHIYLDGQHVATIAEQVVTRGLSQLTNSLSQQRNG